MALRQAGRLKEKRDEPNMHRGHAEEDRHVTEHDDTVYVAWARDHASRALAKVRGVARAEFVADETRYLPVLVLLIRMSESAARVSPGYREQHRGVPWGAIEGVKARVQPDPFTDDPEAGWQIADGPLERWHAALDALVPEGFGDEPVVASAATRMRRGVEGPNRPRLEISRERLDDLCRRHGVRRLLLFGSALRDDFGPASDVDLVVEFEPGADPAWRLASVEEEFSQAFGGHPVEMVEPECLDRYIRHRVLEQAEEIYAA